MITHIFSTTARVALLAAVLSLGVVRQSSAGDVVEMKPEDYKKTQAMIAHWYALLDKGKYAETLAATSDVFRHDLTVEKWAANHAKMLEKTGPVISRGKVEITTVNNPDHPTEPSYAAQCKTKFKQRSGTERLEIRKENGEWKIANYMILPD